MMPADLEPGADEVRGTDAELVAQQWVADLDRRVRLVDYTMPAEVALKILGVP